MNRAFLKTSAVAGYTFLMIHSGIPIIKNEYSHMLQFVKTHPMTPPTFQETVIACGFFAGCLPALVIGMPGIVAFKNYHNRTKI